MDYQIKVKYLWSWICVITLTQKNVILTGGKEALLHFAAIQAAPLYGTIEVRNSGAGCQKRKKPC